MASALTPDSLSAEVTTAMCDEHGEFTQRVTHILGKAFRSPCPECSAIRQREEEQRAKASESLIRMMDLERRLGAAAIPKRFASKGFDQYKTPGEGQKRVLGVCRRYVETFDRQLEDGRCLLLLGTPGTGKTHLAASIANELIQCGASVVYRTMGDILQAIRATYDRYSEKTEAQILGALVTPELLIVDEIGVSKEKPSDFELTTTFSIINGRYERQLPTVIVSNLGIGELPAAMGDRAFDRLKENRCIALVFDWPSARMEVGHD